MKISILGLGYVGFPLAEALAETKKYEVVGFDPDQTKITKIKSGENPIEKGEIRHSFNVSATPEILGGSDIFLVCVPTPVLSDWKPDLHPLQSALKNIAEFLEAGNIVVIESTISPGVCEEFAIPLLEKLTGKKAGRDFDLAHCPERINPGDSKWTVKNIPRNLGATSKKSRSVVAEIYRSFLEGGVLEMNSLKEAEATKIVENTFRDINIAYVNELAKCFDILGIDLLKVLQGASSKPFGFMPHFPSCGVGGHCIPVDPYYLIDRAQKSGFDHEFLRLARKINRSMPEYTLELLVNALNEAGLPLKNTSIGLLGLSYKANVGDLRESPSFEIIKLLEKKGANIEIFDPFFQKNQPSKIFLKFWKKAKQSSLQLIMKNLKKYPLVRLRQQK